MIKIKLSALNRVLKEGLIGEVLAYTLVDNCVSFRPMKDQIDCWIEIDDCCEPLIKRALSKGIFYSSEVKLK